MTRRLRATSLAEPLRLWRGYQRSQLQPDLAAGLTVAVILLPQAIAFALIVDLPPQMGIYAAMVAAVAGALWGSSNQVSTGPTNAMSLLVLSALLAVSRPGDADFIVAAGLLAVMVGAFQLVMGLAGLGVLVNFVSHSVIVGFSTGAGLLIAIKQLDSLLGLPGAGGSVIDTLRGAAAGLGDVHLPTLVLGLATIASILVIRRFKATLPAALIAMSAASLAVFALGLDQRGVAVLGELPRGFPPLSNLPLLDLDMIARLSVGALAVGAIGLVETSAIARAMAAHTGQRLDSNQEFVGQGLANLASGFFSGYPCAGSFSRSAVNFKAGARTRMSSIFSAFFVLLAVLILAPAAVYLPRSALSGVLIVTAFGMLDLREIRRIFRGARDDAWILGTTLFGTVFLNIEFAVLAGILLSFAFYIRKTSVPQVVSVLPDGRFRHFTPQADRAGCPQLGVVEIQGDLYFGAAHHVERALQEHMAAHPQQRYLLLRLRAVQHCDFTGIHALERIVRDYRERGGDVYLTRVMRPVLRRMIATAFHEQLGRGHFLLRDNAIHHLFHRVIDPAVCIYECPVRAFRECQNLPKPEYILPVSFQREIPESWPDQVEPRELWRQLHGSSPPHVLDVREPREFRQGHVPEAQLFPLPRLLQSPPELSPEGRLVLVCRGGRRSSRAAHVLQSAGFRHIRVLRGGMLAWEDANLLEAVEI